MNKLNRIATGIALSSAIFIGQASAAVDGTIGADSTGNSDVTLSVVDKIRITGVTDIALGAFDGTTSLVGSTAFCVYRNGGAGYTMTLSAGGTFEVASASATDSIAFTAKVDGDADASNGSGITHGGTSASYSSSSALDCGGADNASIEVTFAVAALQAAKTASDYTATMVILAEPI